MTYTTNQVASAAQVSLRQLQWWDERRVVSPDPGLAHGSGHLRVWDDGELFKVLLVARMRSKGLSLQRIRKLLVSLPLEKLKHQTEAVLLIRTRGMRICGEEASVRAMDLEDGPVWVICIAPLLQRLRETERRPGPKAYERTHVA